MSPQRVRTSRAIARTQLTGDPTGERLISRRAAAAHLLTRVGVFRRIAAKEPHMHDHCITEARRMLTMIGTLRG